MVSAQARYALQRGLNLRRAFALMRTAHLDLYYDLRLQVKGAPVIEARKDLSGQFPRFGARRINVFLSRQCMEVSKDRCSRIWSAAELPEPVHGPCRCKGAARYGALRTFADESYTKIETVTTLQYYLCHLIFCNLLNVGQHHFIY